LIAVLRRSSVALGTVLATVLGAAAAGVLLGAAAPAQAVPQHSGRAVIDTQPHYRYANAVRESVWVRSSVDSDHDGKPDRIAVDIVRPRTRHQVPVILEASPYYSCCGRGNEYDVKTYDRSGVIRSMPLYYDNYFVPRGYAFVAVDLPGTARSTGCPDLGGPAEIGAVTSVINWLNGDGVAHEVTGGRAVASWSTGAVGMIGKSWDASVANGVAATGVPGLKTVVDISGISSWYDYDRFNGVLRYRRAVSSLASLVDARRSVCGPIIAAEQRAASDGSRDLNHFWAVRNYRSHADRVTASVFVSHGLNDLNVTTPQFADWWSALAANGVPRKIWLSQDGHVDPFDYRRGAWVSELHRWFDHWLLGLHTGVMAQPQASIQRPDGSWTTARSWPVPGTADHTYDLAATPGVAGRIGTRAAGTVEFTDHPNLAADDVVARPFTAVYGRAAFVSVPFEHAVHISGSGSVRLRVRVDRPDTELSARVVDYGRQRRIDYAGPGAGIVTEQHRVCRGVSSALDSACYLVTRQRFVTSRADVLAGGWLDAAHHESLQHRSLLTPGAWYDVTVPLAPIEDVVASGHRLGLVLSGSDTQNTDPTVRRARVRIDLARSAFVLPLAPLAHAAVAPGSHARITQ
jgi:X-Pro dipeptidyl-peptidase